MNNSQKSLKEWKHVFLDTSVIVDYLSDVSKIRKNQSHSERLLLVHKIMSLLFVTTKDKKRTTLYISAITLSELKKLPLEQDVFKHLVSIFSAADVVIVDYSKFIALELNRNLERYLPNGQKHQFEVELTKKLKQENVFSAKQWVADDLKIVATAKTIKDLDAVLTCDSKIFLEAASKMELPVVLVQDTSFGIDLFGEMAF